MPTENVTIGVIGGSGMLGRTIVLAILKSGFVPAERIWISNRSGYADGFEAFPGLNVTTDNQQLASVSDVVVLSVPPALKDQINIRAPDKLIISVMAGTSVEELTRITGSPRVVRAMSSPAAKDKLAYSPWCPSKDVSNNDRRLLKNLLSTCGVTDEVNSESDIEIFTALTGPVPGFVALFADAMVRFATSNDISPVIADRAVRQLFLAAGKLMSEDQMTPAEHVQQMIDYAGTTAAGLEAMQQLSIPETIAEGLGSAVDRVKTIG